MITVNRDNARGCSCILLCLRKSENAESFAFRCCFRCAFARQANFSVLRDRFCLLTGTRPREHVITAAPGLRRLTRLTIAVQPPPAGELFSEHHDVVVKTASTDVGNDVAIPPPPTPRAEQRITPHHRRRRHVGHFDLHFFHVHDRIAVVPHDLLCILFAADVRDTPGR